MVGWLQGKNDMADGHRGGKLLMSICPGSRVEGGAGEGDIVFQVKHPVTCF